MKAAAKDNVERYRAIAKDRYNDTYSCLSEYKKNYGYIYDKYLNTYALGYIREALVSQRALSIREAVNLFEMYDQQQQIMRKNNEKYNEIIAQQRLIINQQEDMRRQYNSDRTADGICSAFAFAALMLK